MYIAYIQMYINLYVDVCVYIHALSNDFFILLLFIIYKNSLTKSFSYNVNYIFIVLCFTYLAVMICTNV